MLARDFGLGTRGKSNPMRSAPADRRSNDDSLFSDVFGGQPKHAPSSNSSSNNKHWPVSDFDYDSIFKSSAGSEQKSSSSGSNIPSSLPVYDKPVYDEDIFDGLPGLKSKSAASTVKFDDDVFATISSPQTSKTRNQSSDIDDFLGNLRMNEKVGENNMSHSAKSNPSPKGFDDLLAGFGSVSSAASNRYYFFISHEYTWIICLMSLLTGFLSLLDPYTCFDVLSWFMFAWKLLLRSMLIDS